MCEQINFHLNLQLLMYVLIFKYMALLAVKKPLDREISIRHLGRLRTFGERPVSTEGCFALGALVPSLLS